MISDDKGGDFDALNAITNAGRVRAGARVL